MGVAQWQVGGMGIFRKDFPIILLPFGEYSISFNIPSPKAGGLRIASHEAEPRASGNMGIYQDDFVLIPSSCLLLLFPHIGIYGYFSKKFLRIAYALRVNTKISKRRY
jgi:hypothetical protein